MYYSLYYLLLQLEVLFSLSICCANKKKSFLLSSLFLLLPSALFLLLNVPAKLQLAVVHFDTLLETPQRSSSCKFVLVFCRVIRR